MKRYLISGAMTLIAGLILTSCHDKDVEYSYGASQKTQAYDQAFKETFGTPAAGHNWGFAVVEDNSSSATRAATRTAYPNSNLWAQENWVVPTAMTEQQKDKVRRYFQTHQNPRGISVNYTNYFVEQVYKGNTNLNGSSTQEQYTFGNGDYDSGSKYMDKLTAGTMEDHIYNFNNAESGGNVNGMMLMKDSQTNCFGFHNSRDSKQYNDHYVIVPGNIIDEWEATEPSVTGMFFVGFDYEADKAAYDQNGDLSKNTNMYLVTETTAADGVAIPNKNDGKRYHIGGADGYYSDWIVRITKGVKKDNSSVTTTTQITQEIPHGKTFRITKWVVKDKGRVFCEDLGGNYTTDREDFDFNDIVFDAVVWSKQEFIWEDRAVQATDSEGHLLWEQVDVPKTINGSYVYNFGDGETTVIPEGKTESEVAAAIVKESVDATDENNQRIPVYKKENGALVYERVELEEYRGQEEYYAEIVLVATGATIGCSVAGVEVHDAFGVGYTTMVNTVGGSSTAFGSYVDKTPVYLGELKKIDSPTLDAIPITVLWKSGIDGATKLRRHNTAAGAAFMDVPQKFQVPLGTPWSQERVRIDKAYPSFLTYVKIPSYEWTTATGEDAPDPLFLFEQSYPNIFSGDKYVNGYEDTELVESDNYHTTSPEVVTGDPVNTNPPSGNTGDNNQNQNQSGSSVTQVIATPGTGEAKIFNQQSGHDLGNNNNNITLSYSQFEGIGNGSIIRVYGWPKTKDYSISVDNNYFQALTSIGAEKNSRVTFEKDGYEEYKITATALSNLKTSQGMVIHGTSFMVSYVTLDNTNATSQETVKVINAPNAVWTGNESLNWWPGYTVGADKFSNITSTSTVKIYGNGDEAAGWQVQVFSNGSALDVGWPYEGNGVPGCLIQGYGNDHTTYLTNGYISFRVDATQAASIKDHGLQITGDKFTLRAVAIE